MSHDQSYEVAIVGGGIAGLSLAILCAQQGLATLVIEKDNYPRHKVCGEYVSLESARHFERLGLSIANRNLPQITRLQLSDTKGKEYEYQLPLGGMGISRFLLDDLLYQRALSCGVQVLTSERVEGISQNIQLFFIETNKGLYQAKVAVNAFGKRSNLDLNWKRDFTIKQQRKLTNWVGVKYHIKHAIANDTIALHNFKGGYCGISKVEDDITCLCYLTQAINLKAGNGSIKAMEERIIYKNPRLKEIFTQANFLFDKPLTISQVNFSMKNQVEQGMMMIGDSAGLITPLCGNGMSMAFHASVIAFENLLAYLTGKASHIQMLDNYSRQWQKVFGTRLLTGRVVQSLFGNPAMTKLFLQAMHAAPFLARQVIRSTHGKSF